MPDESRIPTSFWVGGCLRRMDANACPYYVVKRGAGDSGTVLLKINLLNGSCRLLSQGRDSEGGMGWLSPFRHEEIAEQEADAYIRRAMDRDPDLWVIEIESKNGENPFEGGIPS